MATKSDITSKVTEKHPLLEGAIVSSVVNRFFKILSSALKSHNRIEIRGFGSFSIRSYNIRRETNNIVSNKFLKRRYFKTYFRSSKKLSHLVNE